MTLYIIKKRIVFLDKKSTAKAVLFNYNENRVAQVLYIPSVQNQWVIR